MNTDNDHKNQEGDLSDVLGTKSMTTAKSKRSCAVVKKQDARLVGASLSNQSIRIGLVEGIKPDQFDLIQKELIDLLAAKGEQIELERMEREEYETTLSSVASTVRQQALERNVDVIDVLKTMTTRSKVYIYPNEDGSNGTYKGKGPQPQRLKELIDSGHSLEDYEVSLDGFME
ncbi:MULTISPECIES: H-NS histone family protein [Vibrio]|uniref:H-NS histone family protein n=1 Tax=Vibrio TaxID=662 RepID=UPI001E32F072|nr:H-NS histone family protein [Vibrio lentus]MCC4838023.1 H-NS histone family protein [Vibrio lentus]